MNSIFQKLPVANKSIFHVVPLYFFLVMFCLALGFEFSIFSQSVYDQKRLIQLATFMLLGVVLLVDRSLLIRMGNLWANFPPPTRIAFLLVAVLGVISSYFAPLPKHAFQEWSLFGLLFIFALYVGSQLVSFSLQKVVLAMLAIAIALYSWRYLTGAYIPSLSSPNAVRGYELFIGFAHPRFLNQIQSWVLPLMPALPVIFIGVPRRYHWLLWVSGLTGWMLLFASSGRATLIAMIFSAIVVFLLFHKRSLLWLKTHAFFAISGLILYIVLFHWLPQLVSIEMDLPKVTERLAQSGLMGRDRLWGLAWEIALANPLIGLGPQQYANYNYHAIAAHPHSAYLQWLSEWGLLSFGLLSGLLVYGFAKWVKFCRITLKQEGSGQSILLIALTASLVAGATHALVSGIIVMPFSQMMMGLIIGWVLAVYFSASTYNWTGSLPNRFQHVSLLVCVVIFQGTILYSSFIAIAHINQLREEFLNQYPHETILKPRFWDQGLIGWQEN
jgi:O-antigen ligase